MSGKGSGYAAQELHRHKLEEIIQLQSNQFFFSIVLCVYGDSMYRLFSQYSDVERAAAKA
jgi:hypothetical protein